MDAKMAGRKKAGKMRDQFARPIYNARVSGALLPRYQPPIRNSMTGTVRAMMRMSSPSDCRFMY